MIPPNPFKGPFVSAIMITGKYGVRIPWARAAVRAFEQQTHTNSELVIINTGQPILEQGWLLKYNGRIREHKFDAKLTLGELRNIGLDVADGQYIVQWDDDDWYHPTRIAEQLKVAEATGVPVTLMQQVRYSFVNNNAYVCCEKPRQGHRYVGIPGTVLHPKTSLRYPAEPRHEDTHFLQQFDRVQVELNQPELYLRFHHGHNTWGFKHIMRKAVHNRNKWDLPDSAQHYLESVLKEHYGPSQNLSPRRPYLT